MLLLLISAAVTIFLLATFLLVSLSGREAVEARLMEISSREDFSLANEQPRFGIAGLASGVTSFFKPIRDLITANDEDLTYRLAMAGFRKPEHAEIYTAAKMLLPVLAILLSSFTGSNMVVYALLGGALGFFGPDLVVTQIINRRRESIRHSLPDALDLLVICMEAGLGIDQALVRVGEEVKLTSPALAEELLIINREQRAGKPRLEAWRSMADRLDIDYVGQFVRMLVRTGGLGTPLARAPGQFADG